MDEELCDVCDTDDRVLRQATRGDVHANGWIHRAVHIWVFRSDGSLLLHRRSATKDTCPLKITSSASGHVDAGEGYHACALRELQEELGLQAELHELTKLPPGPLTAWEHSMLYGCTTDEPASPDPGEIAEVICLPLGEWQRRIEESPLDFAPVFIELWNWYRAHIDSLEKQ
jgi:isopentenyl-diphosphate Delta-isomerase